MLSKDFENSSVVVLTADVKKSLRYDRLIDVTDADRRTKIVEYQIKVKQLLRKVDERQESKILDPK